MVEGKHINHLSIYQSLDQLLKLQAHLVTVFQISIKPSESLNRKSMRGEIFVYSCKKTAGKKTSRKEQ